MLLIGMFDSPFVRRVAITLKLLDLPFEHGNWSIDKDFERIRQYNPLGRVPTLVLDSGDALIESAAILDYLDELAGARALLPRSGTERRQALRLMAIATGAAEKGVAIVYEGAFRPAEKRHEPWLARCRTQVGAALMELNRCCAARGEGEWLMGASLSQPDITAACVFTFLTDAAGVVATQYPALAALTACCEALPGFQQTRLAFFTPNQ
jgi:glutathione S-transferase